MNRCGVYCSFISDKPYAVVEFTDFEDVIGVTFTKWIAEGGDVTLWPKHQRNEKTWLKSGRVVKNAADLQRNWIRYPIKIIIFAGMLIV